MTSQRLDTNLDLQALTTLVLQGLRRSRPHQEIVTAICYHMHGAWNWQQAEQFLQQVYTQYSPQFTEQKVWFLSVVSLITILSGLASIVVGCSWVFGLAFMLNAFLSGEIRNPVVAANFMVGFPRVVAILIESGAAYQLLFMAVIGLGMVAGGLVGIVQSLRKVRSLQELRTRLGSHPVDAGRSEADTATETEAKRP